MILTQVKKNLRGYWNFFVCANAYTLYKQVENIFRNFHIFFFICFFGVPPSRVLAGTKPFREVIQPQRLQSAVQEPQNLVLSSFSCPHQDATLTFQEHSSVITQKSVINRTKKPKSIISVITKNPLYPDFPQSVFNRLGVFRSVRDLKVHKRMRSSDATCFARMAVNTCFFSTCEMPPSNMASRSPKTWCITHFHVLIRCHPHWDSIIVRTFPISSSKTSKTGKNQKIQYKSVITKKSVIFEKSKIDF